MGRPPKDGKFVNVLMDKALKEEFEKVVGITGKTKTAVIETALRQYIEPFCDGDGKVHPKEAVYVKTGQSCIVLKAVKVKDKVHYRIYYEGEILTVPEWDIVISK